jgi:exodeoxyribonuclease VII large subunit
MFPGPTREKSPLTVSQVTREIKTLLEDAYPSLCVEGEISGYKPSHSGHIYFSLKDDSAVLPSVIWRSATLRLRFEPRDGMHVIAVGNLGVYEPQGKYQLYVDRLWPVGEGALELAFRQLKEKLFAQGYFDPKRKRPIPSFPRRIGVVTSPTGAAIHDILKTLGIRWPALEVVIFPVRVQGPGADDEIADAIALANRLNSAGRMRLDLLIVGRGGGSLEDLWAFNELAVADAIFRSHLPIVSGVGHETDMTIADLVADVRAVTPTAAATAIVPDRMEVIGQLQQSLLRLRTGLIRRVDRARQRLDDLCRRRPFLYPSERIQLLSRRVDELLDRLQCRRPLERIREFRARLELARDRLSRAVGLRIERGRQRQRAVAAQLAALNPLNVLSRGFSLTTAPNGTLLRSTDAVRPGDRIHTRLARGRIVSRVESVELEPLSGEPDERSEAS